MLQELKEAEDYVRAFGTGNAYASHMVLMVEMARMLDEGNINYTKLVNDVQEKFGNSYSPPI